MHRRQEVVDLHAVLRALFADVPEHGNKPVAVGIEIELPPLAVRKGVEGAVSAGRFRWDPEESRELGERRSVPTPVQGIRIETLEVRTLRRYAQQHAEQVRDVLALRNQANRLAGKRVEVSEQFDIDALQS